MLPAAPSVAAAVPDTFVTRSGTQLWIGTQPWYLYGGSTYGTSEPGAPHAIADEIALATAAGLNTLRIVNMFDERGLDPAAPFEVDAWTRVDELLAAMDVAGLHAILDLSAFRNHLHNRELHDQGLVAIGDGSDPAECSGSTGDDHIRCVGTRWCLDDPGRCTNPYSVARATEWDAFLAAVAGRTNSVNGRQYSDDPTIALVAFAGEPSPPDSGEPLRPDRQELTDFYARVFDQWKTYDANHLVTSGGLLHIDWEEVFANPNGSGIDHAAIFALPNQDVLSIHDYFPSLPPSPATDYKLAKVATAAAAADKPWITEEFGFPQAQGAFTEADRGAWFRTVFEAQRQPPVGVAAAGVAFWNLGPQVAAGSHDVNAGTPATWAAVIDHAPRPLARSVSVVGSGAIQVAPSRSDTFEFTAIADEDGDLDGEARIQLAGGAFASGSVTCLSVDGDSIVLGAQSPGFGGNPATWFTLYVTDNGPDGLQDTFAYVGPTSVSPADCQGTSPSQHSLWYGQATILEGPSEAGTVSGQGTSPIGQLATRTFEFDAERSADGTVSGSFSISESQGFSTSGQVVCLDIRANHAMLVGRGTAPGGGGGGSSFLYTTIFIDDLGPSGSGDRISVSAYRQVEPFGFLADQEYPGERLITGDVDVNGSGGGPGPAAAATVVATGAVQTGPFASDSFDVAAISDGAGDIGGNFRMQHAGSSFNGTVTCVVVTGNEVVVGAVSGPFNGNPILYATLFMTDNGADGTTDTVAFDGPTGMAPPDCSAASPPQQSLWYGQVTILDGPSVAGTVSGDGTNAVGRSATRTFQFDGSRDAGGIVTGTFSIVESQGFSLSGSIDCIDIRGEHAMVIGHGPSSSGGGSGSLYATIFIDDGGPAGAGDLMYVGTYRSDAPFGCLAAQDFPGEPLLSGDVDVNAGATPTPTPTPTPTLGAIHITSLQEQGGTLAGVSYQITGTNGFDLLVDDDHPADTNPGIGIIVVTGLDPSAQYLVCPVTIPADWYVQQGCTYHGLQGSPPIAGLAFDYRFITPLTIDTSIAAPASVPRFGRFEKTFRLSRSYHLQVHDPDTIEVTATFTAPSGVQVTVPAYWTEGYVVTPGSGITYSEGYDLVPLSPPAAGQWRVRFSPDEVGSYSYTIRAQDKQPPGQTTVVSAPLTFSAAASAAKGQVELDPRDDRFLRHADGTPYLPMGHNVAFQQGAPDGRDGEHYVQPLFESMAAAGQNWTRIWMTDFNRNALEWSFGHWAGWYTGVGQYAGQSAFRIERQLDIAEQYGLQVQLVINDHGQVSSRGADRWSENPYNAARGGPVPAANPEQFFTNPSARELFKQRLRYLVARYGAYRNLLAWELFNEVQFTGSDTNNPFTSAAVRDSIVAWHAEMAAYLRSIDPYDHLITTSSDIDSSMADIWADPNIDLVQVHDYGSLAGRDQRFRGYAESLNATYDKPVIIGEFGLQGDPEVAFDPTTSTLPADRRAHLVEATHLHNAAWAAAMSASGAMSWWWGAYIHDRPLDHRFRPDFPANERVNPPLRDFFAGEDLAGMGLQASSIGAPASVVALGLDNGSTGFAWVRDALNEYGSGVGPGDLAGRTISGVSLTLPGFLDGTYRVEVHDPWGAAPVDGSLVATAAGGTLTIPLPSFQRDIALKVRPGGPAPSAVLPPGGTLTSDDTGDGPDATDPVATTITTPVGGHVTIASNPSTDSPASGFGLVGVAIDITAPAATAANPLVLVFRIDSTAISPGDTAATVSLFRNGVLVGACTGAPGTAAPDPCVSSRATLGDGDVELVVRSSAASTWSVGVRAPSLGAITIASPVSATGAAVAATAPLTDAGPLGGHTAVWAWGDGMTSSGTIPTGAAGTAVVSGSHAYGTAGIRTVTLTVTDPSGQVAVTTFESVVVYATTSTVAGDGTIVPGGPTSAPGDSLPGIDGTAKASVAVDVRYKKNATRPSGTVSLGYPKGKFKFAASTFDWLVVSSVDQASIAGLATVSGRTGAHPFRLVIVDGDRSAPKVPDRWVLRIWAPGADVGLAPPLFAASGDITGQVKVTP